MGGPLSDEEGPNLVSEEASELRLIAAVKPWSDATALTRGPGSGGRHGRVVQRAPQPGQRPLGLAPQRAVVTRFPAKVTKQEAVQSAPRCAARRSNSAQPTRPWTGRASWARSSHASRGAQAPWIEGGPDRSRPRWSRRLTVSTTRREDSRMALKVAEVPENRDPKFTAAFGDASPVPPRTDQPAPPSPVVLWESITAPPRSHATRADRRAAGDGHHPVAPARSPSEADRG